MVEVLDRSAEVGRDAAARGRRDLCAEDRQGTRRGSISRSRAAQVERQVRAFNPAPGAFFEYEGERIKVLAAEISELSGEPGTVLDHGLTIACGEGSIVPSLVQRAGRGPMTPAELLRGFADSGGRDAGVTRFRLTIEYDGRPVHGLAAAGARALGPAGDRGGDRGDHPASR